MADPVTIGVILAASAAVSAVGAIQQGAAAAAQGRAQQQAQQVNAAIKEQNSVAVRQQAGAREEQQRRIARQVLGQQRAALAQAGIGVGFGSALDIEEQSAIRAEYDALAIRYEGEMQATGLLASAQQDLYQGQIARAAGKNAQTASYISAGASLLSGAASYGYMTRVGAPTEVALSGQVSRSISPLSVNSGMGFSI
jgi:hypothetical protein